MASTIGVASSLSSSGGRPVLEPGALFVDGSYALRFNAWCSVAGVTLALRSRFLRVSDDELVNSGDQLILSSNRALNTTDVQLGVGFPLNVTVFAQSGTLLVGQCFVQVQIVAGIGAAAIPLATVLQGYVTTTQGLGWPGSPIVTSTEGEPAVRVILGTAPGIGNEFLETVPSNARWEIVSFLASYNNFTAGNKLVNLIIDDGVHTIVLAPGATNNIATGAIPYEWWPGFPTFGTGTGSGLVAGIPFAMRLLAGSRIRSGTFVFAAGDSWFAPVYTVREWLDV